MKKKILGIFVCMLLIATALPAVGTISEYKSSKETSYEYNGLINQITGGSFNLGDWPEQDKLTASDGATDDYFGISVSIDGDYALIGAHGDDSNKGSAYVFKRGGTTWVQEDKLTASDGATDDRFGRSVSIDGDYALIGAHGDNDNGASSGSAYVFKRGGTTWVQEDKLTASDGTSGDIFGGSVSIDGDYALIGAPGDDGNKGSAYVFKKPTPDLDCLGSLSWTDISPGATVTGSFMVANVGEADSELSWEIESYPTWGTWTFIPSSGTGLTPGMGTLTVAVEVVAPNEKNQDFTGDVKVVNSEDSNDYDILPVSLSTPRNKPFNFNFNLLEWLFERFPNAFPILKYLLVVSGLLNGWVEEGTGTLVMQITDAPGLNITEAIVNISQIRVHYAGTNQNDTNGTWIVVANESQTFDLIQIQNATEFLGDVNLSAGWYTQIRLSVDKALVTIDGVQYDLKIPSKKVKLIKPFLVQDNETLTLTLDFDVQKSVHETGNGKYIMKPTIKVIQE